MRTVLALTGIFLFAGCGHRVAYTALNAAPRPLTPRDPSTVEVFVTAPPARPYVEVGLFEIEQRHPHAGGTSEMLAKIRARAAQTGCDAVIVTETTSRVQSVSGHSHGTVHAGPRLHGYAGSHHATVNHVRGHRAACIVYSSGPESGVIRGEHDAAEGAAPRPGAPPSSTDAPISL